MSKRYQLLSRLWTGLVSRLATLQDKTFLVAALAATAGQQSSASGVLKNLANALVGFG